MVMIIRLEIKLSSIIVRQLEVTLPSASVSFIEGKEMNGISVATLSEYSDVQIVPHQSAEEFIGLTTTP